MGKARERRRRKERKAQRREARQEFSRLSAERRARGEDLTDLRGAPLTAESIPEAFARLVAENAGENYPGEHAEKKLGEFVLKQLGNLGVSAEAVNAACQAMGKEG